MPVALSEPRRVTLPRLVLFQLLLPLVAVAAIACSVTTATAQEYQTDKVDPQAKRHISRALAIVRNPGTYATDRDAVLQYLLAITSRR